MKRILAVMLLLSLLCGCGVTPPATTPSTQPPETSQPTEPTQSPAATDPALDFLRENLPVMDGSTSLIPLEAGIRAALFGISMEEATAQVSHSTTWDAFYHLLQGDADLVFSVPLSQFQRDQAAYFDVVVSLVPVAKEGFVFVVNAENPVDSLTQQQIKDIYAGKITNWKEVGGLDEEIIPYQRNTDSGSQNFMIDFMGDTPLMDAPTHQRPDSMAGLMDVIAVNDHARASIGYSVYAYAADMYGNGDEIKFIQVDGVSPSRQTFADGSYPLLGINYAMFRADEPEDSPVRQLTDWITSRDGQLAVAAAGYVPVMKLSQVPEEETLERYQATGTGPKAQAPTVDSYELYTLQEYDFGTEYLVGATLQPDYQVTQLADPQLQEEVNAFIREQMVWVEEEYPAMLAFLEQANAPYAFQGYDKFYLDPQAPKARVEITGRNGYLSVAVSLSYQTEYMDVQRKYYRTETATWDALTGKRLTAEELFCQGVDIDQVLNDYLRQVSQEPLGFYGYPDLKQDFAALTTDGWHLTHDTIYFDHNTPWFYHGDRFSLDGLADGTLACQTARDFTQAVEPDSNLQVVRQYRRDQRDHRYAYLQEAFLSYAYPDEASHPNAAKVRSALEDYLSTYYTREAICGYFAAQGYDPEQLDLYMMDWYMENLGDRFLLFHGFTPSYYMEWENAFHTYPYPAYLAFDLETGQQITWQELLKPGWEDGITWSDDGIPPSGVDAPWEHYFVNNGQSLSVHFKEQGRYYYATIDWEYLRMGSE